MNIEIIKTQVANALFEDLNGEQDITALLIPEDTQNTATIITRETMILAGQAWANETFQQVDPKTKFTWHHQDGDLIQANDKILTISGNTRALLTAERTALNFLQTLSSVATTTYYYNQQIQDTTTKLLDTRKTIPGLRHAEKYAVTCGGGKNHRIGLYDAFLIKENHITSCGSIESAIETARKIMPNKKVEIEVENLNELRKALDAQADIIMLDNFNNSEMREAVKINNHKAKLEASGDVNINNIREIALTGVDYISVGALTKNIKAINLSMRIDK